MHKNIIIYSQILYYSSQNIIHIVLHVLCLYDFYKPSVFCWWPLSSSFDTFLAVPGSLAHRWQLHKQIFRGGAVKNHQHSCYSSAEQSSAMLCSCAMAASSLRNSAYRTMANTRLLAWGGIGGQGGKTPRGGKARAFLTEPLGRDGSRMMSPPWDSRHSEEK